MVSLHCALDDKTTHLADKKMLGMMKDDAILINAARGPIHHEDDLVAHLKANPNFRSSCRFLSPVHPALAVTVHLCRNDSYKILL